MDLLIIVLIILAIVIGGYLGWMLSPQRGEAIVAQQAKQGALQKFSVNGFLTLPLSKKTKITHDTYLFVFDLPEADITLGLKVGQHIAIHQNLPTKDHPEGEEIMRKYTPTSKVDHKGSVELVIKVYRAGVHPNFPLGGIMSQWLETLKVGDSIKVSGPIGKFNYTGRGGVTIERKDNVQKLNVKRLGLVCGGTGITPMYQVMRSILDDSSDKTEVNLLFANKTIDDILIKGELEGLRNDPRVKIAYTLDNPPADWKGFGGFVTEDMIKKTMPGPGADVLICTCGPPVMTNMLAKQLVNIGYAEDSIFKF